MPRDTLLLLGVLSALATGTPAHGQDSAGEPADAKVSAQPVEAWADPGLKVTRGLALWLDAGRLNAAREAHDLPEASDGSRVDLWHDASGHGRHLVPPNDEARPEYRDGALRFDGEASHLEGAGEGFEARDVTLFIVAAPFSNSGDFRAFLALNREGQNDYTSGLTIDQGFGFSFQFQTLNVEGNGFSGMADLMDEPSDFGVVRRMTVTSTPGPGGTKLFLDGRLAGARDRAESSLASDRITVGARRFAPWGGKPEARGFLDGDILEILVYDRVLDEEERRDVEDYLAARHGTGRTINLPRRKSEGKPLVPVADPPPVQMLVPGFSVSALPVDLPNINNVRYRDDGTLVALAYNGDIFLLSDGSGTGLEDTVALFWENQGRLNSPIGMALTPPDYRLGEGVFVASKGKLSLIVDTDGDGKADEEIIVADGWNELPHGVDALGVAVDENGAVYFGLGAANFANAYLLDPEGQSHYDLQSERGTILRVSPDFETRGVIATGIRFSVGLAFNRLGDLFATDQEGATWLPNGNPFDELLHIQRGRHYGFPPRHPDHLPGVIDEPSVFDYRPQHQATCGLTFNDPVAGVPSFGPASWDGDALVAGYSRGKLYRTQLAKTPAGYVAKNQILACLDMLTVDVCVSPAGDLVVAAHSGLPDWGSGPTGRGQLYKIRYSDPDEPQPAIVWASGPQDVRVAFDRPLDPNRLGAISEGIAIEFGQAVSPGDRFETLRPGYEVVGRQLRMPRFELPVLSVGVSPDWRTLLLTTAPMREATSFALTIPGLRRSEATDAEAGELPQHEEVDLGYDLSGVVADWRPASGEGGWSGWLPHLDLAVARAFTSGSAEHDRLWEAIQHPGRLTLRTQLDLRQMLRPDVQLGATLDYALPDEQVTLTFTSSGPIEVETPAGMSSGEAVEDGRYRVQVTPTVGEGPPLAVAVFLETGTATALDVAFTTDEDDRPRALPLRRFLVPWAAPAESSDAVVERTLPELEGGDWGRGRALFFGELARCADCHRVRGRGSDIGPDLSNLIHRDYHAVLRDIQAPSAAINPDYIAHTVALADGRVVQGTLRTEGDWLIVSDSDGQPTIVDRSEVEETTPSAVSIMPEGLDEALGPERLRDLLTFLLTDPLPPAPLEAEGAPPPRRRSEVEAVLEGSAAVADPRPLHIVLVAGPKDHGPGEHDYPLWQRRWSDLLAMAEGVSVHTADGWPDADQLEVADVLVLYSNNPGWSEERAEELDRYLKRGGGLVAIHYAVDGHDAVEALADRIGLAWQAGVSRFRHGELTVDFGASSHPITRNFETLDLIDESYWNLIGDPDAIEVLGTGVEEGAPRPLFWTRRQGEGRVFVSIPGHFTWTFDDPLFRVLLLRGMAWAAGEPVDRFNELATPGARISD